MDKQTKRSLCFIAAVFAAGVIFGGCLAGLLTPGRDEAVWMPQIEYIEEPEEPKATEDTADTADTEDTDVVLVDAGPQVVEHSLGEFKLTAYCTCSQCCGQWADGFTASGTEATPGRTIAVDPDVIPLGSVVDINGFEYIAEDVGGAIQGHRIDILFPSHEEALDFGVQYANVSIIYKNI